MNFGRINMARLESLARCSGISLDELKAELATRGFNNARFISA